MRPPKRFPSLRSGFSLLEVLLAMSILTGAIAVLGELTRLGSRNAAGARDELTAQLLCETKLNEIACGSQPAEEVAERPLETRRGWLYSVTTLPREQPGLSAIEVQVRQDLPSERRPIEFRLSRLIFRPMPLTPTGSLEQDKNVDPTPPRPTTRSSP